MAVTAAKKYVLSGLFLLSLVVVQCSEKKFSFYHDPMKGYGVATPGDEAWRLPLIEPYDLITANCCTDWTFQDLSTGVDSVNYAKGYILYYGTRGYGLFDTHRKQAREMATHREFADSARAKGLPATLYQTEALHRAWRKTGQLPWGAEILASQGLEFEK